MDLIPTRDEILRGDTTDIYFRRTMEVLRATGKDRVRVTAEAIVKKFPAGYGYAVLSGMDEMLSLLAGLEVDVEAMEEGSLFFPFETVFSIEGPYGAFCELETAMLGDDLPGVRDRHGGVAGQARGRGEAGLELRGAQDAPRPLHADRPERLHRRRGRRLRDPQRRVPWGNAPGDDAARPRPGPRRHGDGDARLRRGGGSVGARGSA